MNRFFGFLFFQLIVLIGFGQTGAHTYTPVDAGSAVTFEIKNLGFNSKGSFNGLKGSIVFDPANTGASAFDVSIDATSINTDNEMRDGHLKKEGYFDVEHYPRIHIVSTTVTAVDKNGHYSLAGKLTIKNTTKDISIPFIVTPMGDDLIFKGNFSIDRKDFEIGGTSTLSNNVNISLTVLAKKG